MWNAEQFVQPVIPKEKPLMGTYDTFNRLISYPIKQEVPCPAQTKDTGIFLVIGQSNSANYGQKKFTTQYSDKVFNYFNGKCYVASSPLLGGTGDGGEFITPLSDNLIKNGTFKSIVIISSGVGGTSIYRWQRDGDLNEMLLSVVKQVAPQYKITDIIWHQGENDFGEKTSTKNYIKSFNSLIDSLKDNGVHAPVFIAIASWCMTDWRVDNPVATAQHQLIDNKTIFLGANTDTLLKEHDRVADHCHFATEGQLKTAAVFGDAISVYHKNRN